MKSRFPKNEAGGKQDEYSDKQKSWISLFLERRAEDSDEPTKREVSFLEFIKSVFRRHDKELVKKKSWIEEAFDERREIEASTKDIADHIIDAEEPQSFEVIMIVAEKFRKACARLLQFIANQTRKNHKRHSGKEKEAKFTKISDVQTMYKDDALGSQKLVKANIGPPPFDFALSSNELMQGVPRPTSGHLKTLSQSHIILDDFPSSIGKPKIHDDGVVKQLNYKPTFKDLLLAPAGSRIMGRSQPVDTSSTKDKLPKNQNVRKVFDAGAKQAIDKLVQQNLDLIGENKDFDHQVESLNRQLQTTVKTSNIPADNSHQGSGLNHNSAVSNKVSSIGPRSVKDHQAPSVKYSNQKHVANDKVADLPKIGRISRKEPKYNDSPRKTEIKSRTVKPELRNKPLDTIETNHSQAKQTVRTTKTDGAQSVGQIIANRAQHKAESSNDTRSSNKVVDSDDVEKAVDYKLLAFAVALVIIILYWFS